MSYELDKRFRPRLISELTACLDSTPVYPEKDRDMFLFVYMYPCQKLFENRNKERNYFERYVGSSAFLRFCIDRILRGLSSVELPQELPAPLKNIKGFERVAEVAEEIVSSFENLPVPLALTCPVSVELSVLFKQLSQRTSLLNRLFVVPDSTYLADWPYTYGGAKAVGEIQMSLLLMANDNDTRWESERSFVQVYFDGFADISGVSESIAEAMSVIRSFFGLLAAMNVIEHVGFPPLSAPRFLRLPVHCKKSDWELVSVPYCDREFSDVVEGLRPTKWITKHVNEGSIGSLYQYLNFAGQCLKESEHHGRLQLAGRWYFDSLVPSDVVSRVLRTTICLEVLYGKSNAEQEGSLTELISSRLAYSIAEKAEERQKIAFHAREFYKLRSKIVHNGHVRLKVEEYTVFTAVQGYVKRAIFHEAKLLWSDQAALMPPELTK